MCQGCRLAHAPQPEIRNKPRKGGSQNKKIRHGRDKAYLRILDKPECANTPISDLVAILEEIYMTLVVARAEPTCGFLTVGWSAP